MGKPIDAGHLQARIYFAHPYASWERGLNGNTNGFVRQYSPKKYYFTMITNTDVQRVEELLNNRPRKTLGYRQPLKSRNAEWRKPGCGNCRAMETVEKQTAFFHRHSPYGYTK